MYLKKTNSQCPLSSSARLGTCLGSLHLPRRTCGHYKAANVRLAFTSSAVSPHHHLMPLLPIYTMDFTAPLDVRLSQHVKEPFPRGRVRTSPFAANLTLLGEFVGKSVANCRRSRPACPSNHFLYLSNGTYCLFQNTYDVQPDYQAYHRARDEYHTEHQLFDVFVGSLSEYLVSQTS